MLTGRQQEGPEPKESTTMMLLFVQEAHMTREERAEAEFEEEAARLEANNKTLSFFFFENNKTLRLIHTI